MTSTGGGRRGRPRLSVVSVCFNSAAIIPEMLEPLIGLDGVEIVVVDNGSGDGSPQMLATRFPSVVLVENSENAGFAKAVNLGVSHASAEVVLLLNPDARIEAAAMDRCLAELSAHGSVGIVAPLVQHPDGRLETAELGREPRLWRVLTHWSGLSRFSSRLPLFEGWFLRVDQVQRSREVDWVSGSCLMVKRAAWDRVAGLSERWFMYAEDVDFCLRVKDAGYEVRLVAEARAEHAIAKSSPSDEARPQALQHAWVLNTYDLYRTRYHPGIASRWAWRSVVQFGLMARGFAYEARGRRKGSASAIDWAAESQKFYATARALGDVPVRTAKGTARRSAS